ncbi:hypothetical protein MCBMB27_01276 [Methylobacterium phyllosphaerae]|uniref:Uncharacterized protein n=1 Tax=Methylobacterium phyllosphaerae TaxID=418223 RepID=A0AAE8HMS9_9HYPH|nr:hypothetical protein MCBMB27_01276 [Methylobacterium phyllosphaerae]SFG20579.1 hypothetical protein SAMN05192567_10161 [Methylobacterium phyllosphaerae]
MNEEAYLRELSDLGRRHGIGLTGRTQLYHLEPEDMAFDYSADAEGFVHLGLAGDANSDAGSGARRDTQGCLHASTAADI